jgi:hypothetical protein
MDVVMPSFLYRFMHHPSLSGTPTITRCSTALLLALCCLVSACAQAPRQSHTAYPDPERPRNLPQTLPGDEPRNLPPRTGPASDDEPERLARAETGSTRPSSPATYNRPRPSSAAPASNKAVSGALGSLVQEAKRAYSNGQYGAAIATAERGLRIDRRTPALYLVMAQSYLAMKQPGQAAQFANQGLRYSSSGSSDAKALEAVRNKAAAGG